MKHELAPSHIHSDDRFEIRKDGLFLRNSGKRLCSAFTVVGTLNSIDGSTAPVIRLRITDARHPNFFDIRSSAILDDRQLAVRLADCGIDIERGKDVSSAIADYIRCNKQNHGTLVNSEGWHAIGDDLYAFATGFKCFGPKGRLRSHYLVEATHHSTQRGSLEESRAMLAQCIGNPLLVCVSCAAFLSPMLRILNERGFFICIFGPTSTGKTTATRVARSISDDPECFFTWDATEVGIQTLALSRPDHLLVIDEIRRGDFERFGNAVYALSNGKSRLRSGRNGMTEPVGNFWNVVVSTSETNPLTELRNTINGNALGLHARLIALRVDKEHGVFETLHGTSTTEQFARRMSAQSTQIYGVSWARYIRSIEVVPQI